MTTGVNLTESIAKRVEELPMLSVVASRLLEMLSDEDVSLREVAKIVQTDGPLTARILRIANSAAFSRGKQITSLFRAVMHLGMRMVIGITIGSCATRLMNRPLEGYEAEAGELWDHSLRTAIAAREFAFHSRKTIAEDLAFTGGLLHDIGKSVISDFLVGSGEKLAKMCADAQAKDYLEAERSVLGTDHSAVGSAIAQRWGLPQPLCESIRNHHNPSDSDPELRPLIYAVHLADLMAMLVGGGVSSDDLAYRVDERYQNYLDIKEAELNKLLVNVQAEFAVARAMVFSDATVAA